MGEVRRYETGGRKRSPVCFGAQTLYDDALTFAEQSNKYVLLCRRKSRAANAGRFAGVQGRHGMVRLRQRHRDDFLVDGVVDGERVTEALTLYSEFVRGKRPRRVFVKRVMKL